ncbi:MAG: septum formation family protein [Acidimicrobiales bacterium]
MGIGDLNSVDHVRWGYRRLTNVANTGWERPAKDEGTCWETEARKKPRREERVELGGAQVSCDSVHGFEVLGVFSVNHDTDAPYPGKAELTRIAVARCQPKVDRVRSSAPFTVGVEYPSETGWVDGDHDVACVAIVERDAPLRD